MVQLIRFYLKSIGLTLPAILLGSVVINTFALILTWISKKPAIFLSLPLTTGLLILSLIIMGIRLNLKDLKKSSFTLASMLPVSQGKLLGAKLLAGCGVVFVGVLMQLILAFGMISASGHINPMGIFNESGVIFHQKETPEGNKIVTITESAKDGTVIQKVQIQANQDEGDDKEESVVVVTAQRDGQPATTFTISGDDSKGIKSGPIGAFIDSGEMGMMIHARQAMGTAILAFLGIPLFFVMIVCLGVYPFIWARHFTKREFLGKVLAVVFIGGILTFQGAVTDSTGCVLGASTTVSQHGPDWISFVWNIAICAGSYLFTAWLRNRKMDLV